MAFLGIEIRDDIESGKIHVESPYYPYFCDLAKTCEGRWYSNQKRWVFPDYRLDVVRGHLRQCFGTDGAEVSLADVEVWVSPQRIKSFHGGLFMFGRKIVRVVVNQRNGRLLYWHPDVELLEGRIFLHGEDEFLVSERSLLRVRRIPMPLVEQIQALFRDDVTILGEAVGQANPLAAFTDAEIWKEVIRRGLVDESDPDEGLPSLEDADAEVLLDDILRLGSNLDIHRERATGNEVTEL